MRATDLLGRTVYDSAGVPVGRVHDLRFDTHWTNEHRFVCRLTGLDCHGAASVGHHLGYGMGDMAGPWPLDAFFRRRRRKISVEVEWSDIARIGEDRIELRRTRDEVHRISEQTRRERDRQREQNRRGEPNAAEPEADRRGEPAAAEPEGNQPQGGDGA